MRPAQLTAALAVAACLVAAGCSDDDPSSDVAATVGDSEIGAAAVAAAARRTGDGAHGDQRALRELIQAEWLKKEAQRRGWRDAGSAAVVARRLEAEASTKARQRLGTVASYYRENRDRFRINESRLLYFIRTHTKAEADRARRAIENGMRWTPAAQKYSVAETPGGVVTPTLGIVKGERPPTLDMPAFTAKPGELIGPLEVKPYWVVFAVKAISRGFPLSMEDSRARIEAEFRRETAIAEARVYGALGQRYRSETECTGKYKVPECRNGPVKPVLNSVPAIEAQENHEQA